MVTNKGAAVKAEQADIIAKNEAPKKERKMLTPAERVAKLEAELAAAREKARGRDLQQINKLLDQRKKLVDKVTVAQAKVVAIDEELQLLGFSAEDMAAFEGKTVDTDVA